MIQTYLGWSLSRVRHSGMWQAHRVGRLPIMADSLGGIFAFIREGGRADDR